jgi:hypothetical protein
MSNRRKFKPSQPPTSGAKIAPHAARQSTDHFRPVFNPEHLKGKYCLTECNTEEKATFADALFKRSKMTWHDGLLHPLGATHDFEEGTFAPTVSCSASDSD